jgi:hypothetical protein
MHRDESRHEVEGVRAATRSIILALGAVAIANIGPACAGADVDAKSPAMQRLIRAYTPIQMLRNLDDPCDDSGEQFQPSPVSSVLGNPDVQLKLVTDKATRTVKVAPTAGDIAGLGDDYYLNLPGDPLNAGCTYAEDFSTLKKEGDAPAVAYAHVATEPSYPGFVVQYWFFYYFNQFNDVHEGDWEGMQISFDATSAAQALRQGPSRIAVFQHGGGEAVDWSDSEVEKEGTHPVVYPAAGSHATFFESAVFVENGQGGAGLGCDNTTEPLRRLRLKPVPVPTYPARGSRSQWLSYRGHWGQKEKGFNTGPTGPNTKTQWLAPFSWMNGLRSASPRLPGGALLGPAVTNAFCGTVAAVSQFVNLEAKSRLGLFAMLLAIALLIAVPIYLTRWRPVELVPLRQRRAFGQLIRAARQLYGRQWMAMVPIGLVALPILAAIQGLGLLAAKIAGDDEVGGFLGPAGAHSTIKDALSAIGHPVGYAVVAGAVIAFWHLRELDRDPGIISSYRYMLKRFWRLIFGHLAVQVATLAMAITIIGIPFAIRKYVDWQFVQQEILFEDKSIREAMRSSSDIVRGHWWWTVRVSAFFWLIGIATGPVLGFALIFANLSLISIDLLGSLVFALLIPYVATGRTLLYLDLEARLAGAAPVPRRSWVPPFSRIEPTPQPG